MTNNKILITGGAGYVGSVVARHLLSLGYHVRVLDSLLHGGNSLLGLYSEDKFEFIRGDIRDKGIASQALLGIDGVVHLAAIVGDPACARQPEESQSVNLEGSMQIFEAARNHGVNKFVFASTCSNYGKMIDTSQYVTEESELRPVSLYAENKVAVETSLLSESSHDSVNVTILRLATAFGLSPRMRFDLTVNEFTLELLLKKSLMVYGEQFWRPYIHVCDIARAVSIVLEASSNKISGRVFNVGDNSQNFRKGEIVELVKSVIKQECKIQYVKKEEDPRDYRVSFDRINNELGFSITRTVEDGIREIADVISKGVIAEFDHPYYRN